jgi:DNA polymerase III gamma/tau subunit
MCTKDVDSIEKTLKKIQKQGVDAISVYEQFIEYIRTALMERIKASQATTQSEEPIKTLRHLGMTYATQINSELIFTLLEKGKYLKLGLVDPYMVVEMIVVSLVKETK